MKRSILVVFVVVTAVLSAGFVGAAIASDTGSGDDDVGEGDDGQAVEQSERTITVTGAGSVEAAPDRALVSVGVVAEGDDPAAVRDDLHEGADGLRESLATAGVDDDQLQTIDYRIHEQYYDPRESEDFERPAYRGVHTFHVTVDDVDDVGNVTDAAADAGANVQWVAFTLSEERRTELRDRALTDAMDDARHQADTLAAAGELTVTGVRSVDASDRQFGPVGFDRPVFEADEDEGGTVLEPGDVTVSVRVHVTYDAVER